MDKKATLSVTFLVFAIFWTSALGKQEIDGMHYIPRGQFNFDNVGMVSVAPFYLSDQITNAQFRELLNYAKANPESYLFFAEKPISGDSIRTIGEIRRYSYEYILSIGLDSSNWPTGDYFESEVFDDSPVIGVPEELAKIYCAWRTQMNHEQLKLNSSILVYTFNLPMEVQLAYARELAPHLFQQNELGFRITTTTFN